MYKWKRRVKKGEKYYEVSTKGDTRFSSLVAKLATGKTIEETYQLDVKGYGKFSTNWRIGKGRPAVNGRGPHVLWIEYKKLWVQWFKENPKWFKEILELAKNTTLTDMFATSDINQAHAICDILNDSIKPKTETKTFLVEKNKNTKESK